MMKTFCLLLLLAVSAKAQTVSLGSSRQDVISQFGEPQGTVRFGVEEVLSYQNVEVQLRDGRVVKVLRLNDRPLTPKTNSTTSSKSATPEAPKETPVAPPRKFSFFGQPATTNQPALPPWMQKSAGVFSQKSPRTPLKIAGIGLILLGLLVAAGGGIWLLVRAFGVGVGWGLACLFLPFAPIVFICMHWEEGGKPFLVNLGGAAAMVVGFLIACA